jgi:hypothetical protein
MSKGLDEILSGEEPAQVEQPTVETPTEPTPEPEAQPRGPDGKFAPKANEPEEPQPAPPPVESEPHKGAPPGVLEERNRRKSAEERAADLERQLAEVRGQVSVLTQQRQTAPAPQPKPEPPKPVDFWEAPDKFVAQQLTPIQEELAQDRFERSLDRAITKHGEGAIEAAETAMREAIQSGQLNGDAVKAQMSRSRDPIGELVAWHQNQPASIEARLRAEIEAQVRAELGASQPQPALVEQPSTPAPSNMPSNLVGQRNVGTRSGPAWSGPASLNDIFDRSRAKKAG